MPVTVNIADIPGSQEYFDRVFDYLEHVDEKFSTYKYDSEISRINRGEISSEKLSKEMKEIFTLSEKTKKETLGYFDIQKPDGSYDPSGIVKGWAIKNAAQLLKKMGCKNFFVDVGGDIESRGIDEEGKEWSVGIRSPFNRDEIVKVVYPKGRGVATSGVYIRGKHIYNPHSGKSVETDMVSLTVIGPDVYEADRFATAAFAMGNRGIEFIESISDFEGYAIDKNGIAVMTSGFLDFTVAGF